MMLKNQFIRAGCSSVAANGVPILYAIMSTDEIVQITYDKFMKSFDNKSKDEMKLVLKLKDP